MRVLIIGLCVLIALGLLLRKKKKPAALKGTLTVNANMETCDQTCTTPDGDEDKSTQCMAVCSSLTGCLELVQPQDSIENQKRMLGKCLIQTTAKLKDYCDANQCQESVKLAFTSPILTCAAKCGDAPDIGQCIVDKCLPHDSFGQ